MPLLKLSELDCSPREVVFRVDVNKDIGAGHAVRCMAIADCIERDGGTSLFVVSGRDSASTLLAAGKDCVVIPGDPKRFDRLDGSALGSLCHDVSAVSVLVDSYAVTDAFFEALKTAVGNERRIAWIDDLYTYELGEEHVPVKRQADCVVNYSLGMDLLDYERVYADVDTKLCISPCFAPLRSQFSCFEERDYGPVKRMMVTTGSTNEGQMLERMVACCLRAVPQVRIDVMIGSLASFVSFADDRVVEHRGVTDLAPFMRESDICVCAAGTTIYELSAIGVPSVAIPIVANQMPNVAGFKKLQLGLVVSNNANMEDELMRAVDHLAVDPPQRKTFVSKMHETIDGKGARRIASELQRLSRD